MSGDMRTPPDTDDARLVELSRNGNRDAFARIVERYQSSVCALTWDAAFGGAAIAHEVAVGGFCTRSEGQQHGRETIHGTGCQPVCVPGKSDLDGAAAADAGTMKRRQTL